MTAGATTTPALLRGHRTGEGVFETLRLDRDVRLVAPPGWSLHLDRMRRGAARMDLPWPGDAAVRAALGAAQATQPAVALRARVTLWADGGDPRHEAPERAALTAESTPLAADDVAPRPWTLAWGGRVRNPAARLWDCKHVALAESLSWRRLARAAGADDALLCAVDGQVSEATTSTAIFGLGDGRIVTPGPAAAPLPGTSLARLRAALPIAAAIVRPDDLDRATWAVLVNAVWGVRTVERIDTVPLRPPPAAWLAHARRALDPVGSGHP